jgi:hypothetical protein
LDVINGSKKVQVEMDVERMNQFFVTRSLDFQIPIKLGVPEFKLITVEFKDAFDSFMAVELDASGLE